MSINLKSLTFAHENFFLYDNENITETYVSEMNENISIYGRLDFWERPPIRTTNVI